MPSSSPLTRCLHLCPGRTRARTTRASGCGASLSRCTHACPRARERCCRCGPPVLAGRLGAAQCGFTLLRDGQRCSAATCTLLSFSPAQQQRLVLRWMELATYTEKRFPHRLCRLPWRSQIYPANTEQASMMTNAAMRAGFSGGLVVDFPHRCFWQDQAVLQRGQGCLAQACSLASCAVQECGFALLGHWC